MFFVELSCAAGAAGGAGGAGGGGALVNMWHGSCSLLSDRMQRDNIVWTPPSLALPPAFAAAFIGLTEARLLSAGGEPELKICRYSNQHVLAAFLFWQEELPCWKMWATLSARRLPRNSPPVHQSHLTLLLPAHLSFIHCKHFSPHSLCFCCGASVQCVITLDC